MQRTRCSHQRFRPRCWILWPSNWQADAYLLKPIDEEQLRNTIQRIAPAGNSILVIDDDPNALEMVEQYLVQVPEYTVLTALGGQAGLHCITQSPPDLIILDLMMPEIDGFAVLEQLGRHPQTRDIPVIVMTAKDLTDAERRLLNSRVQGLLSKAVSTPEYLLSRISALLGKTAAANEDPLTASPAIRNPTTCEG